MKQDVGRQEVRQFGSRNGIGRLKVHQESLAPTKDDKSINLGGVVAGLGMGLVRLSLVWDLVCVCVIHELRM